MLTVRDVSAGYENGPLFEDVTFTLNPGDRVGIVGQNGAGKSTLLHIMHGDMDPEMGAVTTDDTIGYLEQVPAFDEPISSYMDRMSGGLLSTETALQTLYPNMGDPQVDAEVGELQSMLESKNGWDIHSRIAEVLSRLGAPEDAMEKTFGEFSGGQQSRILLAGQLVHEPDVLLLDEPTNNLDQEALEWLESYLRTYKGAVAIVSHDRAFLDNTVTKVIEIDGTGSAPEYYEGGFTDYRTEKAARLAKQILAYEAQEKKRDRLETAVTHRLERSEAFDAMGKNDHWRRIGKKLASGAKAMEHRLERLQQSDSWIADKPEERKSMPLYLSGESRKGRRLVAATALRLGYGIEAPTVIEDATFTIHGQDRVGITGNNGSGKTTLLNAVAGKEELVQAGSVETFTDFSYLTQTETQRAARASKDTALEWFRKSVGAIYEDEATSLLVWFGFDKDQIWQPVNKMSPGEINKLTLLGMTFSGRELLLLDEPTNHLDFDALDVVEHVLSEFKGTIVTVSHDRQFLGNIACNRLFTVSNHRVSTQDL